MGTSQTTALTTVVDMIERGTLEDGPNVTKVRIMGVQLVRGRVPREVRQELNAAVKIGRLGHLKKDGLAPEAYFHPNSLVKALEARDREVRAGQKAIMAVTGRQIEDFEVKETVGSTDE